jgi:small-conductance mechanosensitive channel
MQIESSTSTEAANTQSEIMTPDVEDRSQQVNQGDSKVTEPSDELKAKLDQIAKRDRFLTQRERRITELERSFSEKENGLKSKYSRFEGLDEIKNPVKVLEKMGYSVDEILEASLSDDDDYGEPKSSHKERQIEELKAQIEKMSERYKEDTDKREKEEEQRIVSYQKNILQNMIGSNAEKWPYTNVLGKDAIDNIWNDVYDKYKETGEMPDYEEAIQQVEENARNYLKKFSKIEQFPQHMGLAERLEQANKIKEPEPENRNYLQEKDPWSGFNSETLTNSDDSDAGIGERFSSYDEDDLIREAAKMIRWDAQK